MHVSFLTHLLCLSTVKHRVKKALLKHFVTSFKNISGHFNWLDILIKNKYKKHSIAQIFHQTSAIKQGLAQKVYSRSKRVSPVKISLGLIQY